MLKFILGAVVGGLVMLEREKRNDPLRNARVQLIKLPDGSQCERRLP